MGVKRDLGIRKDGAMDLVLHTEARDYESDVLQRMNDAQVLLDIDLVINELVEKERKARKDIDPNAEFNEEIFRQFFEQRFLGVYDFVEPRKGVGYFLANLWINRKKIYVGAGVLSAILLVSYGIRQERIGYAERQVERGVESAYRERQSLQNQIGVLGSAKIQSQDELTNLVRLSNDGLNGLDSFFSSLCPKGSASKEVTTKSYEDIDKQLQSVQATLGTVRGYVGRGQAIVKLEEDLVSVRKDLDTIIQEVRKGSAPKLFLDKAEQFYQSGIESVEKRQLKEASSYRGSLSSIRSDVREFSTLTTKTESLYSSIRSVAKVQQATEEAERLYRDARNYLSGADMEDARKAVNGLQGLDSELHLKYYLIVVCREGSDTVFWINWKGPDGSRRRYYFAVVEAVDDNGNPMNRKIIDMIKQKTFSQSMWAEEVPQETYEGIANYKRKHGILDKPHSFFAVKEVGFLEPRIAMSDKDANPLQRRNQLVQWDYLVNE